MLSVNSDIIFFLVAQSVVIVGAVLVSYINTKIAIAKLQVESEHVAITMDSFHKSHENLAGKVDGISRQVSRMEGSNHPTPSARGTRG